MAHRGTRIGEDGNHGSIWEPNHVKIAWEQTSRFDTHLVKTMLFPLRCSVMCVLLKRVIKSEMYSDI